MTAPSTDSDKKGRSSACMHDEYIDSASQKKGQMSEDRAGYAGFAVMRPRQKDRVVNRGKTSVVWGLRGEERPEIRPAS
jgi:hypothetical protein